MQKDEIKEILDSIKEQSEEENWIQLSPEFIQPLLDYTTNLQEEKDKYKLRCYKAKKMIFDNYGVLDKYEIEILEDILDGKSDE